MSRLGLAIGGAALVLLGGTALVWGNFGAERDLATTVDSIRSVKIDGGPGDVEVRYVPGAPAEVRQHERRWGLPIPWSHMRKPYVSHGELRLETRCGWSCTMKYVVTVPAPVPVAGRLGSGDVKVRGMASVDARLGSGSADVRDVAGPVKLHSGSGDIKLSNIVGKVEVESGSGEIIGHDLRTPDVIARAGSGDIKLALTSPTSVTAHTESGEVDLVVPPGSYRVNVHTGSGSKDIGVGTDPNAARVLSLDTGSGDIRVHGR